MRNENGAGLKPAPFFLRRQPWRASHPARRDGGRVCHQRTRSPGAGPAGRGRGGGGQF